MNVIAYLRVSGATQIDGDGFARQEAATRAFCKANALEYWDILREEGVSGATESMDRPGFSTLIARIASSQEPRIEAIVVERMDRLARDLMVSEMLLRECRERGIKVFSADQGNLQDMASDGGDPTRVLIRQIMGALAQWEKSVLVRKMRVAKERMKAAGLLNVEGVKPYGAYAPELPILQTILSFHNEGKNYSDISRTLNASGCLNRSGKNWTAQNVRSVIVNNKKKVKK